MSLIDVLRASWALPRNERLQAFTHVTAVRVAGTYSSKQRSWAPTRARNDGNQGMPAAPAPTDVDQSRAHDARSCHSRLPSMGGPHQLLSTVALLLLTETQCCRATERVFYSMPNTVDLRAAVRDNATGAQLDTTLCSIWRLTQPQQTLKPVISWDAGNWTGLYVGCPALPFAQTGVQTSCIGSSVVQYANNTFGALLNLDTDPVVPPGNLGTITIEYTPSQPNWIYPWENDKSAVIRAKFEYQVPSANISWPYHAHGAPAIYSTLSFGLHNLAGNKPQYIWYETSLFDASREMSEAVFVDTISGQGIVHGFLGPRSSGEYSSQASNSADSSNSTWDGFRQFDFTVSAAQLARGINAINRKFNFTLREHPSEWALGHFNLELEGTAGSGESAGHSVRGLEITVINDEHLQKDENGAAAAAQVRGSSDSH